MRAVQFQLAKSDGVTKLNNSGVENIVYLILNRSLFIPQDLIHDLQRKLRKHLV